MNSKLKAWLDSLAPAEREEAVKALGDMAIETPDDRLIREARKAAGLSDLSPEPSQDPNNDKILEIARKAAGLK
jgi:hypothetical protein